MASPILTYRLSVPGDYDALKQLGVRAFSQYAPELGAEDWAKMSTGLNDDTKFKALVAQSRCFVCEHNDTIVGMSFYVPHGNAWDVFPDEWSYIRMVSVHPDYQGLGIARALTVQCVDYARATNEQIIALHTSEMMHAARHIYESLGFTVFSELPLRFGKKYWLYTLHLDKS
ncbi:MAG: GNAT family N-acetyltransferase [Bacteroidota bacterium]